MASMHHDIRSGLRTLHHAPGFSLIVVLTLALGIGASTAIFSVAHAVFFRAVRYPQIDRLMFVSRGYPGFPQGGGNFTYPAYRDMLQQNASFETLAAFQSFGALALTDGSAPVRVNVNYVTPSYLELLGTTTALGRMFRTSEDRFGDGDAVVILSHGIWLRQFGGDRAIVGKTIHLNQQAFIVVGVAAEAFVDAPGEMDSGEAVDAWIPLGLAHKFTGYSGTTDRNAAILWGVGMLKAGVKVEQAHAEFLEIAKRLEQSYPQTDRGFNLVVRPLKDQLLGQFYSPVWLLIVASAFILLIGCANVAGLLLARLNGRQREMAVRLALGGTRARLIRQLLVESSILVGLAALLGAVLAVAGVRGLSWWGRANLPRLLQFHVDGWMLLVSLAVAVMSGLLFGLGPALVGSRGDLQDALGQSGRQGATMGRRQGAKLLVVSEVALAIVLLVSAGLLLKSLHRLTTLDLGFNTKNLLTMRVDLNSDRYASAATRIAFSRQLVSEMQSVPAVKSVTLTGPGIPGRATWVIEAFPEGRDPNDSKSIVMSNRHSVNPGALANLGIPLLRGRDFNSQDTANSQPVAIVSESTAKVSWPGQDPIGKRFRPNSSPDWVTVVGLAADARLAQRFELSDAAIGIPPIGLGPQRNVYLPYPQRPNRALVLAVRTDQPEAVVEGMRAKLKALDPTLPVYEISLLQDRLKDQDEASRAVTTLTACYAGMDLFLAALGLFGLLTHAVSRRTQEIGIRMALGALPARVLRMILAEGLLLAGAGMLGGLIVAVVLTRIAANLLFGVSATDPAVYASIVGLLLVVASLSCYLPARRATRVDPMVALRYD